jgi:hypothetical protein
LRSGLPAASLAKVLRKCRSSHHVALPVISNL